MLATAFIGLGSNLGDRASYLHGALEALDRLPGARLARKSHFLETAPVLAEGGPFLNGAAEIRTFMAPINLLEALLEIEKKLGRDRDSSRHAALSPARTIDLDLLWYAGITLSHPYLQLPHPRIRERRFVLEPLCAIAPGLRDPLSGRPYSEFLQSL